MVTACRKRKFRCFWRCGARFSVQFDRPAKRGLPEWDSAELFHLDEAGGKGGAASDVGEAFGGELVEAFAVGRELVPVQAGGDGSGLDGGSCMGRRGRRRYKSPEFEGAAIVEYADAVSGGDVAGGRVGGVEFQERVLFKRTVRGKIAESGVEIVVGFAGKHLEGVGGRGSGGGFPGAEGLEYRVESEMGECGIVGEGACGGSGKGAV